MKRYALLLLAAGATVGCQSPGQNFSTQARTEQSWSPKQTVAPKGRAIVAKPAQTNPDIVQVGYNRGWGSIQNDNYSQKVARAIPSHGGQLPGGPAYPYQGEGGSAGFGPGGSGAPGGHGCPGCGGGGCSHCAGGMGGGPGMGGPGGPGMGLIPGASLMPRFATGRSQVRFVRPTGMKVSWQAGGQFTPPQLETPARYNFAQARIYRLKLTDVPNRAGLELYPTLEVYPGNVKVDAYLAHNAIPIEITEEDLDQISGGNYVTKVIYLPDPKFQELAIGGVETLVSTRLDPGIDPVQEASRRGAILAVLRLGSVDLEMPHSPELFPMAPPIPIGPVGPLGPVGPIEVIPGAMPEAIIDEGPVDDLTPVPSPGEVIVAPE